jgi:hypothetical protein
VIKGTPRYLTGSFLSCIWSKEKICCFTSQEVPSIKMELLVGLARKPDKDSNSARALRIAETELQEAAKKTSRSSTKHK